MWKVLLTHFNPCPKSSHVSVSLEVLTCESFNHAQPTPGFSKSAKGLATDPWALRGMKNLVPNSACCWTKVQSVCAAGVKLVSAPLISSWAIEGLGLASPLGSEFPDWSTPVAVPGAHQVVRIWQWLRHYDYNYNIYIYIIKYEYDLCLPYAIAAIATASSSRLLFLPWAFS